MMFIELSMNTYFTEQEEVIFFKKMADIINKRSNILKLRPSNSTLKYSSRLKNPVETQGVSIFSILRYLRI